MPNFDLEFLDGTKIDFKTWADSSPVFVLFYMEWDPPGGPAS